ncbi:helix-turn-helix transcriptional regulator [Vibrio ostreicida]|uniref:AraC family transcriptional regulator n=1 Tax=Vibrio ostreicida TaxID=526588 RepID=A0ABT8C140_9VIBR|nr:AraC family transcriptional regulator [Vibrio ostreicida]MDN3612374.1 AraC family transcriptional regulator [Vibrio ostreicida]NPD09855.1 helix-turn-helix transcriptional regulator [Vibrio ostreicida]
MAYYRLPFNLDLMEESIQSNGNIQFKHNRGEFSLRCNMLNDEILLSVFQGHFHAPTQLETPDKTECDAITIMLNLGSAVYYQIDSLGSPKIFPSNSIALCYSNVRSGLCRYQPQLTQLFALQIPRSVLIEYIDVMQIGLSTQLKLERRNPFMIIKPSTDAFRRMAVRLSAHDVPDKGIQRHLSYSFMSDAVRYLLEDSGKCQRRDNSERLEKAMSILDKEFMLPPTITQLARRIGTNETSLKDWFRNELNTTVHQYVVQQRMAKAIELLCTATFPIAHIAHEVGYANHGHFTATFKKEFGCTPSCFIHSQ